MPAVQVIVGNNRYVNKIKTGRQCKKKVQCCTVMEAHHLRDKVLACIWKRDLYSVRAKSGAIGS